MQAFKFAISPDPERVEQPFHALVLEPGTWLVQPVTGDVELCAWNAWGGKVVECNTDSTCKWGWLNHFQIWSPMFNSQPILGGHSNRRYKTRELALQDAPVTTFELPVKAITVFYIQDSFRDDVGGLTLCLRKK